MTNEIEPSFDSWSSFYIAQSLHFKNVPKIIINSISKCCHVSYYYALRSQFKSVPEDIILSVSKNIEESYCYAHSLNFKNVPLIIIKSFVKDNYYFTIYFSLVSPENKLLSIIVKYDKRFNQNI